jgi:hypothetical protein
MINLIFWILVIWFLAHYGVLHAFLVFCANVFMFLAGVVA